jgi:hypothetical protein
MNDLAAVVIADGVVEMAVMEPKAMIVAEISKNWNEAATPDTLSQRFERVIAVNEARGFRLHSWRLSRVVEPEGTINETIVAVFEPSTRAARRAGVRSGAVAATDGVVEMNGRDHANKFAAAYAHSLARRDFENGLDVALASFAADFFDDVQREAEARGRAAGIAEAVQELIDAGCDDIKIGYDHSPVDLIRALANPAPQEPTP